MNQKRDEGHFAFQKLIENSSWGITLLNKEFKVLYRNPAAEKINGWNAAKRANAELDMLVHPDDFEMLLGILNRTAQVDNSNHEITFRSKHYDGHYIWMQCNFTNMLSVPNIEAIVCSYIDVSGQKQIEVELLQQTKQTSELLDTMTDGFVSLDQNLCYRYANGQALKLARKTMEELVGRNIWDVFPDVVGLPIYDAIQTCYTTKQYVCNEMFYEPYQLWQENRVYFSAGGISLFIRDITKQKKEEHRLKLLESVITNTTDAVIITEAEPIDSFGQRILYVNDAFTRMTGYTSEEIVGQTPSILQGPKSDKNEISRLNKCIEAWSPCEGNLLNYKKSGEEFWVNFSLNPVADDNGWFTHWISVQRDVTHIKNKELQKGLLVEISQLFNEPMKLNELLVKLMQRVVAYDHFEVAEIWLTGADRDKISLAAKSLRNKPLEAFYNEAEQYRSFRKGESLPGVVWEKGEILVWENLNNRLDFLHTHDEDRKLTMAYGIPLVSEKMIIGVLVIGLANERPESAEALLPLFEKLSTSFGVEIKRKQLAEELSEIFNLAPDIICILGTDGYLKKVNPAMGNLLGYIDIELLSQPLNNFLHPHDRQSRAIRAQQILEGEKNFNFENRFLTQSGEIVWLSWTAQLNAAEGLLFCVGKDITDKKQTEQRLQTSESNLTSVIENTDAFIYSLDLNLRYVTFNTKLSHIIRTLYQKKISIGDSVTDFISFSNPNEATEWAAVYEKALSGIIVQFEKELFTGDRYTYINFSVHPIFEHDKVTGLSCFVTDITERKASEMLLVESENRYSELFQLSPIPKLVFDLENLKFLDVNDAALKQYGYTREDFLQMSLNELRTGDSFPIDLKILEALKRPINTVSQQKVTHQMKSGEKIIVDTQSNPVIYKTKNARIMTARNVTEYVNYINAIELQNDKLREISWMQSHVIRAPLARIMGLIPLIQSGEESVEDMEEMMGYLFQSAQELDDVISKITFKTKVVDPNEI